METSLITGTVRVLLFAIGVVGLLVLLAHRGRRWWLRWVPTAVVGGLVAALAVMFAVNQLWRPFPDVLPTVIVVWTGLIVTAVILGLALVPRTRWPGRVLALVAVLAVVISGAAQVNQHFGAYPTVRAALGKPVNGQVAFSAVPGPTSQVLAPSAAAPVGAAWTPPTGMAANGVVTTARIPGSTSGFAARSAWIYLPPAYLVTPRPLLPVLVLVAGQPGTPRDWFDGGRLAAVMDRFAQAHRGLTPVVVVADSLGSQLAQPLCVDSRAGNSFSYLTVDVPRWVRSTLQVDENPRNWAVGGMSSGGTCALQLAVNAPAVYPTFIDISGQVEPTLGSRAQTVRTLFDGNEAAFTRVNPLDVLATTRFPDSAGTIVAGRDDATYRPQAQTVVAAATKAGMAIRYLELPGGHSWAVWGAGLEQSLPWLATRLGLLA